MSTVKVWCCNKTNEELASICVLTRIRHGQDSRSRMFVGEVFIVEPFSVNRLASCAIVISKIASLGHKSGNNPVEFGAFEMKRLL